MTNFLGIITVASDLDFEKKQKYELHIRATDPVSGMSSEVPVYIYIQDVNDCPPEFIQDSYNISVSEITSVGTALLSLIVRDNDTGKIYCLSLDLNPIANYSPV